MQAESASTKEFSTRTLDSATVYKEVWLGECGTVKYTHTLLLVLL